MRYEDASGAFQPSGPIANDDADTLSAGQRGPATGNLITGEGTQYGSAGADSAAGAHIIAIAGKGGEDSSFSGGRLSITGEHGRLTVDAEGNYSYLANGNVENVRDRFTYTLADNQGNSDTAALIVEIGKTPAVIKANAQQIVPGPDGVVTLPPGVELSDVRVVGRNLVVDLPDGTQLIIIDGAVFVPQLSLGGVEVPASNVAALLIGQEPQPAAGETPPSSGGNFALPPPPLDPGVPLGDLIPPTEYDYTPPEPEEVFDILDREPTITIQPDGQPASVAAVDSVNEAGLPERNEGEPEGSGEEAAAGDNGDPSEATTGVILIDSPDGVASVMINGVLVTGVAGQQIAGEFGTLTITGFDGDNILYSYVLNDNTSGDATHDDFSVTLTDDDGDVATATLTINIVDDVPTARNDTDAVIKGDTSTDGNVMTGVGTTSAPSGVDTVGADDSVLTGVHAGTSGSFTAVPGGGVTISGEFGDLTINPDGSYTYELHAEVGDGGTDVFTYQLTDGDGDTDTATLTITVPPDLEPTLDAPNVGEAGTVVDEAGLPPRGSEPPGSGEASDGNPTNESDDSEITSGTINFTPGDTPATITINGVVVTGVVGQTFAGDYGTLTITGFNPNGSITYSYTLEDNVDHDSDATPFEEFDIVITDVDGDSASDTLRIDIVDDTPTARPDTDALAIGETTATGNVITDAAPGDVGDTDTNAADTVGADDASVTSISGFAGTDSTFTAGLLEIDGEFGTLTIAADGSYTYTRFEGAPGGVTDVFNYTITDNDGDTSSSTLTITIPDALPDLPDPDAVLLDDDALPNGNPGGTGDDPDSQGLPGQLNGTGGDGDLDYNFTGLDTLPAGFSTNVVDDSTVQILQGATVVLTITLDNDTGAFNVVQNAPIDHPVASETEDNLVFQIGVEVEDADGDVEPATITINVDDDTPELSDVRAGSGVDVDETDAGSPAGFPISDTSASAVISATQAFGADGPAAVNATVYGLAITGGPGTGIVTAQGNFAITLVQIDGDTIQGQYQDGGTQVAFTIQMNANGTVTLTQNVPLEHLVDGAPGAPHNDTLDLSGLVNATITITDGDGDTASASAPIGDNLVFFDDGPDAQVDGQASLDQLVLDETTPPGTETDGDSSPPGLVSVQANFANNFVTPVDFGADGAGSVAYSLSLSANGIGSGLYVIDPSDIIAGGDGDGYGQGAEITLSINGAGTLITGSQGGNDYFTISIDPVTGVVTFTQLDNIWHANTASDDDTSTLTTDAPADVQVVQTVTDSDGDFDTAGINVGVGVFHIEDDGPVATNDVDEIVSGGDTAQGNVITGVGTNAGAANADDVGADTPGRVTQISGFGGSDSTFTAGLLEIDGEFGTLTIAADGSYTYTRFDGAPGNVQDVFTYTLTDADGDSDTGTLTINIGDAAPNLPDPALVRLDDDALAGGNPGGTDDDPDSAGLPGQLAGTGGDGTLTYNFTGDVTLPAGFTYNQVDADTAQILQGVTVVLTIQLNQATGAFNVVQNNPIDHPTPGESEENLVFQVGVEVEDADGDVEPATITINVDDDTPELSNVQAGSSVDVDETDAGSPAGFPISDTSVGAVITATQAFGADGPAAVNSVVYGLAIVGGSPEPSGLQTAIGNFPITLVQIDADTIQGQYTDGGTQVAFTIQMNANGTVTLTQNVPLEHNTDGPPGPAHNDTLDLTGLINATITITDGDGDSTSASAPIGDNLVFFDDGPDAQVDGQAALDVLTLDETRPEGTDTPGGSAPNGDASVTANFADNFVAPVDYGGDGPGTVGYSLLLSANGIASGLFALNNADISTGDGDGYGQGASITLSQTGNTITGSVGLVNYFTISIDPGTGVVTFTQLLPIWHPTAPNNFDEAATLTTAAAANVQVVQTVTDSDGDSDTAAINVGQGVFVIQDDGPQAIQPDAATLENEAGATTTADLDDDGEVITDFGEDGPGLVQFANITNGEDSGLTSDEDAITYWLSNNGQTLQARTNSTNGTDGELIFTVQINQATGDYTVTMTGTVDNGSGVSFDSLTSSKAGNVDVRGVGADDPATTVDLLLTASGPGGVNQTINTDSDSVGSGNQSMDQGETVRIDFVTNLEDDPADDLGTFPSGFSYDGHVGTSSLLQTIPQVQGSQGETVAFQVYALNTTVTDADLPDDYPGDGFSDSSIVQVTHVTIDGFDDGPNDGTPNEPAVTVAIGAVGVWTPIAYGVFAQLQTDGSVIFTGVQQGDQYGIETGTDFNAVAVTSLPAGIGPVGNVSSTNSFDLGVFSIGQVDTGEPVDISFDLQITDADGDTVTMPGAIDITLEPAVDTLAATSFAAQEEQLQKSAANSNTLTLAAAVAAAGTASKAAAHHERGGNGEGQNSDMANAYAVETVEQFSVDSADAAVSLLVAEEPAEAEAPASSSSSSSADSSDASNGLGDSPAPAAAAPNGQASAEDHGPAQASADTGAAPPAVAMVSAEQLQAASVEGEAQQGGSVEQIVAEVLGEAPTVDGVLANLPGGIAELAAIAELTSQGGHGVPAWDMGTHGGFGSGADMLFKVAAIELHHDAVQPVVNG